jgi:TRAP-type C4-dicarboxylate transport system substrate-binding protein
MKMRFLRVAGLMAAASVTLTAGAALAQEFNLKLHHLLGGGAPAQTKMLEPWVQAVQEATDGRVAIEIFPAMSLGGTPPELVQQARDGVVDIVWTVNGYTPGLFPRTEVFELPTVHTNDPAASSAALCEMYDEYLAEEYEGLHVLWLHVHAGQAIYMADKEVRSPSDLAGTQMRIPTRTGSWVIEALGASPAAMPVPDLPQALATGAVDGALIPWEIAPPLGLADQVEYVVEGADQSRFGTTTFQVSMNQGTWDSLPADVQEAINSVSGCDWWEEVGGIWRENDNGGLGYLQNNGVNYIALNEDEMAAFNDALQPVVDRWIAEVTSGGLDGQGLVDAARAAIANHTMDAM